MNINMRKTLTFLAAVILGCSPRAALAGGFRLPDQDAFATARGEAFAATADNPSAIYYNPAGITQLEGNNFRAGVYGIYLDPSYNPPAGAPNHGKTYDSSKNYAAVPQFFYTYTPEQKPVSFGLGVYSPFGLSVDWPQDTGFRTIATKGSITYVTINPVMALKLAPNFSIGGGVTVNYANADLEQGLYPVQTDNDRFNFTGDGWGVGYNLGLLWQPDEKVSIGTTFRSQTSITLQGHTSTFLPPYTASAAHRPANADFSFPLSAVFGISYRPTPKWNVEFDADYTDWSSLGTLTIQQSSAPVPPLIPKNVQTILDWQPSWLFEFGATRFFDNGWHASAGYVYNENSVPNAHYSPFVADLDRHFFSIGAGHKGKRFDFDLAYQFCYAPTHTVTGSAPSPALQTANGNYGFVSHAVLVTVGLHF